MMSIPAIAPRTLGSSEFSFHARQIIRQAKQVLATRSATRYARACLPEPKPLSLALGSGTLVIFFAAHKKASWQLPYPACRCLHSNCAALRFSIPAAVYSLPAACRLCSPAKPPAACRAGAGSPPHICMPRTRPHCATWH